MHVFDDVVAPAVHPEIDVPHAFERIVCAETCERHNREVEITRLFARRAAYWANSRCC